MAPAIALAAGNATMFGLLLLSSVIELVHGGNPYTLLWGPGSPLKVVLNNDMETLGERFVEVLVNADRVNEARALKPIDERALPFGKTVMLFDGAPHDRLAELGETRTPGLADLFVATMKGTYA